MHPTFCVKTYESIGGWSLDSCISKIHEHTISGARNFDANDNLKFQKFQRSLRVHQQNKPQSSAFVQDYFYISVKEAGFQ